MRVDEETAFAGDFGFFVVGFCPWTRFSWWWLLFLFFLLSFLLLLNNIVLVLLMLPPLP